MISVYLLLDVFSAGYKEMRLCLFRHSLVLTFFKYRLKPVENFLEKRISVTLRFAFKNVSFQIARTFRFADYKRTAYGMIPS